MQNDIRSADTLEPVREGDKGYPQECADNARRVLKRWYDQQKFERQEDAADKLGVHQSQLSRAMNGETQPSAKLLIALRNVTGLPIDVILGLEPAERIPAELQMRDSQVNKLVDKVAERLSDMITRRVTPPEMPAVKPRRPKAK